MSQPMRIHHLYVSEGHNYFGHFGQPPGEHPMVEVPEVECVAGQGIRGDRFFGYKDDYKGQITFFSMDVYRRLREQLGVPGANPSAFRRNVLVEGCDLNGLIGERFCVQGVWFEGVEECRPCFWMDKALADGAEEALKGHGGLRAKILTSGRLTVGKDEG